MFCSVLGKWFGAPLLMISLYVIRLVAAAEEVEVGVLCHHGRNKKNTMEREKGTGRELGMKYHKKDNDG